MQNGIFFFRREWWLGAVLAILPTGACVAGISLEFEWVQYAAPAEAGLINVSVVLDGDTGTSGLQPVPHGLFSYGFAVRFSSARLHAVPGSPVEVDPALDFAGFNPGARISRSPGFIAVKGNINPAGKPWTGTRLATLHLRAAGPPDPAVPLTVEIFQQSASEAVFVDGAGTQIDPLVSTRASTLVLLQPLRVEWIPAAVPLAAHARLTWGVHSTADFALQWTDSLAAGDWHTLPGAPHNSGEYLDYATVGRRYYRLTLVRH